VGKTVSKSIEYRSAATAFGVGLAADGAGASFAAAAVGLGVAKASRAEPTGLKAATDFDVADFDVADFVSDFFG
jgi:hypothetical protein